MALNFTEALMEAKRRAQLQGRPLSQAEARGISEGYGRSARETTMQEQSLGIQEKGLAESSRQFSEQLAQRKYETELERKAAEEAAKTAKMEKMAAGAAGIAGGVVGGVFGGPVGAAVGAGVGSSIGPGMYHMDPLKGVANATFGKCIIISACTSHDSHEVNIARRFRNGFMDIDDLTGYYLLCPRVVGFIHKSKIFKKIIKSILVDRLVDYGECYLGLKPKRKYFTSYFVSKSFLSICRILGKATNLILEAKHG